MYADGGCWSALGKAPGFEGNLKFGITLESLINGGDSGMKRLIFQFRLNHSCSKFFNNILITKEMVVPNGK